MNIRKLTILMTAGAVLATAPLSACGGSKTSSSSASAAVSSTASGSNALGTASSTSGSIASSASEVSVSDLATKLLNGVKYDDELSPIEDGLFSTIYPDIPESDVAESSIYLSSGSTAEEIAVFKAADEKAADEIKAGLEARAESQKTSFKDYVPAEVDRLDKAVIVENGVYVVFSVSGDPDGAKKIIDDNLK